MGPLAIEILVSYKDTAVVLHWWVRVEHEILVLSNEFKYIELYHCERFGKLALIPALLYKHSSEQTSHHADLL